MLNITHYTSINIPTITMKLSALPKRIEIEPTNTHLGASERSQRFISSCFCPYIPSDILYRL